MDYKSTVHQIKQYGNVKRMIKSFPAALIISFWISPYISAWAIRKKLKPNDLTLMMIPIAFVSSVLFFVPLIWVKLLGMFGFHLFFAFDLADGQVARGTKTFSKYGEQLDHIAHHCSHIFILLSIGMNLYQIEKYTVSVVCVITGAFIFAEYAYRNICSIETEISLIDTVVLKEDTTNNKSIISKIFECLGYVIFWFRCADNYALIAAITVLIDSYCNTDITIVLSIIYILSSILKNILVTNKLIKKAYK